MDEILDKAELLDDLTEQLFLVESALNKIAAFEKAISKKSHLVHAQQIALSASLAKEPREQFLALKSELQNALAQNNPTSSLKKHTAESLHMLYGALGSLLVSTNWQSPSYDHSLTSKAGVETGKISGTLNDYRRDHHRDADNYENAFRSAYIDSGLRLPPRVYLTSSGMAAFTTIIDTLLLDKIINGPILVGQSCYFECKKILENLFPDKIHYVDEMNVTQIIEMVKTIRPSVIFLDSLCNTENISVPNMRQIIKSLSEAITRPTTLVIDNTGLGVSYQPLKDISAFSTKLFIITFESLIKYHQFGLDRVSAGVIWTTGLSPFGFSGWRMHLGTNMPDASARSLPDPNRALLEKRLARLERNATYLAETLEKYLQDKKRSAFSEIIYPGLASYPGFEWTKNLPFHGSYFVLKSTSELLDTTLYKKFISRAITNARHKKIDLIAGSSFGFNTTRLYLTALHADKITKPFLRISVGTETASEIKKIGEILIKTIEQVS